MWARRTVLSVTILLLTLGTRAQSVDQVRLDIFFSPGCTECEQVKREVLPEFEEQFEGLFTNVWHDLSFAESVPLLVAYQERCGNNDNGLVAIVVDHSVFLSGFATIAAQLEETVNNALVARQSSDWQPPLPPLPDDDAGRTEVVQRRAESLTWTVVIGGGLLDGINPCAISTLIFFMSVLVISKATRRTRLLMGLSFISASFTVYTALGLGFLYLFRRMPSFPLIKLGIEGLLGLMMVPLAVLSFRDALRFRHSQRADEVTLQIPAPIKARIHRIMRSRMGWGGPVLGGLAIGSAVTILESVCTGQSYIPVLAFMLRGGRFNLLRLLQLLTYNLCFVLPLLTVFIAFHRGVEVQTFLNWSKRNLVAAKLLLGVFFTAMALLFLWPLLRAILAQG